MSEQLQFQHAISVIEQGDIASAEVILQSILSNNPHHLGALVNYVGCLEQQQRRQESVPYMALLHSLHPENALFALTYARALNQASRYNDAIFCLQACLKKGTRESDIIAELAWTYWAIDDEVNASAFAYWAKGLNQKSSRTLSLLAKLHEKEGDYASAIEAQLAYIHTEPQNLRAQLTLGDFYEKSGDLNAALDVFLSVRREQPDNSDLWALTGRIMTDLRQVSQAESALKKAISLDQKNAKAHYHYGNLLSERGQFSQAKRCFEQSLKLDPTFFNAIYNLGLCHLSLGHQTQGFAYYKTRWNIASHRRNALELPLKRWCGDLKQAEHVLVWTEQGLGDGLFFGQAIYALDRILRDQGNEQIKLTFACDPRLRHVFSKALKLTQVVSYNEDVLARLLTGSDPPTSHIPLGDLLCWFWEYYQLAHFPKAVQQAQKASIQLFRPYLKVGPSKVHVLVQNQHNSFMQGIESANIRNLDRPLRRVGISWHSIGQRVGGDRSIPLETLLPLMHQNQNIQWINLQYGDHEKEIAHARNKLANPAQLADAGVDTWHDVEGLVALISTLDLVVSIDNSTIHMAGCLGVPTWLLLGEVHNWRWPLKGVETFWYPKMKIKRWTESTLQSQVKSWARDLSL